MNQNSAKQKIWVNAGAVLVLVIPYFILHFSNTDQLESSQSLCPFKMMTGFPCPGCGITKSLVALYEGDIVRSIHYHLFGLPILVFCAFAVVVLSVELICRKEYFRRFVYSRRIAYFLGGSLAVYHFTRVIIFVSSTRLDEILHQSIWK